MDVPGPVRASLVAQRVKNLPAMQETQVQSLSREDPLEKRMATHFSILFFFLLYFTLPGELHGQRSLAGYSPWGCRELDTTEQLTHTAQLSLRLHSSATILTTILNQFS